MLLLEKSLHCLGIFLDTCLSFYIFAWKVSANMAAMLHRTSTIQLSKISPRSIVIFQFPLQHLSLSAYWIFTLVLNLWDESLIKNTEFCSLCSRYAPQKTYYTQAYLLIPYKPGCIYYRYVFCTIWFLYQIICSLAVSSTSRVFISVRVFQTCLQNGAALKVVHFVVRQCLKSMRLESYQPPYPLFTSFFCLLSLAAIF